MSKSIRLLVVVIAALCACGVAYGEGYFFTNVSAKASVTANANYEGGARPAEMTASGGLAHTVYATNAIDRLQTLTGGNGNFYLGEIVGDAFRQFNHNGTDGTWWKYFYFGTLARFPGLYYSTEPFAATTFIPSGETAKLPQVDLSNAHKLTAKKSGATLEVGRASGRGTFFFNVQDVTAATAGDISIADPLFGPLSYLGKWYGNLSLPGADETAGVPGDPYLHLDATASNSFTRAVSGDRNYVSKWEDVRGGDRPYAYAANTQYHKPWMATDPDTGLDVVDFGGSGCDYGWPVDNCENGFRTGGWSGLSGAKAGKHAWLKLSEDCTQIREVFVVLKEAHLYNCQAQFLGNGIDGNKASANQPFRRGYILEGENGGRFQYGYYHSAKLFRTVYYGDAANTPYPQTMAVQLGDIRLDGQRVRADMEVSLCDRLHVLSVGTAWNVPADRIGDNGYGTCYVGDGNKRQFAVGGFTLGEMLIYTNVLTSAERRRVNNYLRQKWQRGEDGVKTDLAQVTVSSDGALDVPSGTLRAKRTQGAALVKTGAGTYEGGLPPASVSLDVRGGKVAFTKPFTAPAAAPTEPAMGMDVWLDAERTGSMSCSNSVDGTKTYVLEWDHRLNNSTNEAGYRVYATRRDARFGYPTRVKDAEVNNRYVVDFGLYRWNSSEDPNKESSTFSLVKRVPREPLTAGGTIDSITQNYTTRTGFIVFRTSSPASTILGANSTYNYFRHRLQTGSLFDSREGHVSRLRGGYFAIDGTPIDCAYTKITDEEYHVLSFRLPEPQNLNQIAGCGVNYQWGGLRVGEWICYDRPLSDKEFRDTEAYLLKKWLDRTHPDVKAVKDETTLSVPFATFAGGASFDTDYATTVASLNSDDGTFAKGGTGDCTVKCAGSTVTNVTVGGGSVTLGRGVEDLMAHAYFRFDASAADTLTTNEQGEVTEWRDRNGNGFTAVPLNDATHVITNRPTLKTLAINGIEKPCIELGPHCRVVKASDKFTITNTASAFQIRDAAGGTGWSPNLREWVVVAKDTTTGHDDSDPHAPILSGTPHMTCRCGDELHNYMVHPCWGVLRGANPDYSIYKCRLDGAAVGYNHRLWRSTDSTKHNFHVFSMAYITNHIDWTFKVRHLGGDANTDSSAVFGGLQLCEVMVFETPLEEADRVQVTDYLRKKWLSADVSVGDKAMGTIQVAAGASLDLTLAGWENVSAASVSGGGTLAVDRPLPVLSDVLPVNMPAAQTVDGLTVEGELSLPRTMHVVLTVADGLRRTNDFRGRHPILTADALGETDVGTWTLEVPAVVSDRVVPRLVRERNTVYLDLMPKGLTVILR